MALPKAQIIDENTVHAERANVAPRELALPGMHENVMAVVRREFPESGGVRVLDAGAGEGSLSAKLLDAGYQVSACDLYPDLFRVKGIECRKADALDRLPYDDATFDLVVSVEVIEHLDGHGDFFREIHRILKPGGRLVLTTPNMQSLKSRMRFLLTGYYYSFGPLDPDEFDPVSQHISPMTIDRHRFVLRQSGFDLAAVSTDKMQKSSLALIWLAPLTWLCARIKFGGGAGIRLQNSVTALCGRTLFMVARRRPICR